MILLKIAMCGLLVATGLIFGGGVLADTSTNVQDNGTITLYFRDGSIQCSFPSTSRMEKFPEEPRQDSSFPCKHLSRGGYFTMSNFPSATRIWLVQGRPNTGQLASSPKRCGLDSFSAFSWYELLTIKNPTSSPGEINTLDLKTLSPGQVITSGLRFIKREVLLNSADPDGINCLIIEASP
jgi:hypothetical protein